MAKKTKAPGKDSPLPNLVNESSETVKNGLADAVGQNNPFNFPQGYGAVGSEPLSNANTLFKNLRWYLISNYRQVLAEIYCELGLVQTIVDVPVDDALRGGIKLKSKQLDEDQIEELLNALDRDNDIGVVGQAAKWNRLFGGAGVIILTDQDPSEPLDIDAISEETELEFRAVDMWELTWDLQNAEGHNPSVVSEDFDHYNYYGEKLHKSRVLRMKGLEAPSFIRPRLRGWGFSICEVLVRSINQYLKATDLGFEVLDEFKLDVYKIKNLVNTLIGPGGQEKIAKRVQLANWQKNYQNAVVMDSEDDFDHKQLSFAGLAEAMAGIRMQVASDLRMPITKLFGQSVSGGIGNNDQNDMENYNSMVEGQVRQKIKYPLLQLCEIKCQYLFGFVPDDLALTFVPLRVLTAEQEENVKTQKFNRIFQAKGAGEISTFEFREACNKGALLDISLDTRGDALNPDDPEVADILEGKKEEEGDGEEGDKEKVKNEGWEEGKHPRADDGKFGKGGGGKKKVSEKVKSPVTKIKREKLAASDSEVSEMISDATSTKIFSSVGDSVPELKTAVKKWSGAWYVPMRQIQKGEDTGDEDTKAQAEKLLKVFDAAFNSLPEFSGPISRDLGIDLDIAIAQFKEGEEFEMEAYSSFSAKENKNSSREVRIVVDNNSSGRAAWGFSEYPTEAEVIVPKGQKYKINKVQLNNEPPQVVVMVSEVTK